MLNSCTLAKYQKNLKGKSIHKHILLHGLEREAALGDVAEYGGDDADGGVSHSLVDHGHAIGKYLDEEVSGEEKGGSGEGVAEQLLAAMEVRLREDYVAGQYETRRETDGKGNEPGCHFGCNVSAAKNVYRVLVK